MQASTKVTTSEELLGSNDAILEALLKSGAHFANLFVQNDANFIPLPQSGTHRNEIDRFVAQVNDVIAVAHLNRYTKTWSFKTFVFVA